MAQPVSTPVTPVSSYADVADLAVEASTIIDARIRRASPVPADSAAGVPAHLVRFYVEADVNTLIFGHDPVARRIGYLVDRPRRADGRPPRIKGERVLLFARPVTQSNRLLLVRPGAQLTWDAARDSTVRSIVAELGRGAPPPRITGISQAFHVAGTVPEEGETQIFLQTATGDPVSLTVLRRPGQEPQWAAAFGEIVDESATVPGRRTLGWYRLACDLPAGLPPQSIAGLSSADAAMAREDFAFIKSQVGVCDRSPSPATAALNPR